MALRPPDRGRAEDLGRLAGRAAESLGKVREQVGTVAGRLATWTAGEASQKMPEWAEEHIAATRQLDQAIQDTKRQDLELSSHTYQLLDECKKGVRKLALVVQDASEYLRAVAPTDEDVSTTPLLKGQRELIADESLEWHLNLGLMMDVYRETDDPRIKKQIGFLALQYLAKAAPMQAPRGRDEPVESHLGFFEGITYHRLTSIFEHYFQPVLAEAFNPNCHEEEIFLVDTKECQKIFPIFYTMVDEAWADKISNGMSDYLEKGDFSNFLKPPLAFDFTDELAQLTLQAEGEDRNALFEAKRDELEAKIEQAIDQAVAKLRASHPNLHLSDEELKAMIRANITCFTRHEIGGVGVIKILKMLHREEQFAALAGQGKRVAGSNLRDIKMARQKHLETFLNESGIRLGAVRGREALFEMYDLEVLLEGASRLTARNLRAAEYAPKGKNVRYFPNRLDFTNIALFQRFASRFSDYAIFLQIHPELAVLGKATVDLLEGLLNEISDEKWEQLNTNPETRALLQSTLYRLAQHLARAENNMDLVDVSAQARVAFAQAMELAQAEISTLLTLFSPFEAGDFEGIYKEKLSHIPEELQGFVTVGVGKTAMNVFAGINMAVKATVEGKPQRVIGKGSYYELFDVVGSSPLDARIPKVDLYVAEFSHNIDIDPTRSHYEPTDVIGEIEALLADKPETERLTVAVDESIDFVRSDKVHALLERFSGEIQEGKLNFVFFRSGQKFDMLGMDHYYGSPFYMVNNGDEHWQAFQDIKDNPLFQADPLSMQWFCLANKCGFQNMEDFRAVIFQNARRILDNVPQVLKADNNPKVRISTAAREMDACFIDLKITGDPPPSLMDIVEMLEHKFAENGQPLHRRASFGFPHANFSIISDRDTGSYNIRITPGLDRKDIVLIAEFLEDLAYEVTYPEET